MTIRNRNRSGTNVCPFPFITTGNIVKKEAGVAVHKLVQNNEMDLVRSNKVLFIRKENHRNSYNINYLSKKQL
ncbi:hypothetical protein DXT99_05610 [Pontibacter diazotrophicus]|uniref:Uncharacterized protein n=1 Tax=Pontibacter diazotrophicus TaxID=1400979 RepID=A0A3D8LFQ1_9BACT|nr:hypothetical protein DXT99_05610 [Pontibacter diazotrophicus]